MAQTTENFLPAATGQDLGSTTQQWDVFVQNGTIYGTLTGAGAITSSRLNSVYVVDGTTYTTVAAAVAACMTAGGGTVFVPAGTHTISSTLTLGNSSTKPPVDLVLDAGATLNVTVNSAGNAIVVHDGCGIRSAKGGSPFNPTYRGAVIQAASTANIAALITNGAKDGTQQMWYLGGLYLRGHASATITTMLDFTGGAIGTVMRDLIIDNFPSIGLRLIASGSVITSDLYFDNVLVAGTGTLARPVVFSAPAATTGGVSGIYCNRFQVENAGTNQKLIELTGLGTSTGSVNNIYFTNGLRLEAGGNSGVTGLTITDCHDIFADSIFAADGGTDIVKISETGAGKTWNIGVNNIAGFNWTNGVNDTINSKTIAAASNIVYVSNYQLDKAEFGVQRLYNTGSGRQTDFEALQMDWSSNTARLFTQHGGTGTNRTLQIGTNGTGSLTLMTNSSNRWAVDGSNGHFLAQTDNAYDIGASGATRPRILYVGTNVITPSIATPKLDVAVANGANANVASGTQSFIKLTGPTGAFSISGFTGGADGRVLRVYNSVAQAWTITNDATSTAANRIITKTGGDVVLAARQSSATFVYDSTQSRWILMDYEG